MTVLIRILYYGLFTLPDLDSDSRLQTQWLHCTMQKSSHCTEKDSNPNCQLQDSTRVRFPQCKWAIRLTQKSGNTKTAAFDYNASLSCGQCRTVGFLLSLLEVTGVGSAGGDLARALTDFFVRFRTANSGLESVTFGFSLSESSAGGLLPKSHTNPSPYRKKKTSSLDLGSECHRLLKFVAPFMNICRKLQIKFSFYRNTRSSRNLNRT